MKEKKQSPRRVSGFVEMKRNEKKRKKENQGRDASRALVLVMLVLREEGGGLETRFDVSRAPRARRR
jgi:hypothetical protein